MSTFETEPIDHHVDVIRCAVSVEATCIDIELVDRHEFLCEMYCFGVFA